MAPVIWVVGETRTGQPSSWTLQLTTGARQLADQCGAEVGVVTAGGGDVSALAAHGADHIVTVAESGEYVPVEQMVAAAGQCFAEAAPLLALVPDDIWGRDVGSQLAARAGSPFLSACERVAVAGEGVSVIRSCYGGQVSLQERLSTRHPRVLGVREHTWVASATRPGAPAAERTVTAAGDDRIELIDRRPPDPATLGLAEAQVIISGGRGVGGSDGFMLLGRLAELLGGTTAASRVAVDQGWVPRTKQVGQTGSRVAPQLYLACGISGAREHMVGIRDAAAVVAVNIDERAPIMKEADLAIVGDVGEIVSRLVQRLESGGNGR